MQHSAASDLGLICLPVTLLRVSRLQWINPLLIERTPVPTPLHAIYKKILISILGMSGFVIKVIPREKWLYYLQTVETLIRHHVLQHLVWVCTVCQLPF